MSGERITKKVDAKYILSKTGPGLIMAAAAVGTGTVSTSAMLGARYEYALVWMVVLAMLMRGTYMRSAYRSQIVLGMPVLDSVRKFYGKTIAIIAGFTCAFGCIAYECGNFSGTGMGMELLFPMSWKLGGIIMSLVCLFFIFGKNVYKRVEKFMKLCVLAMMTSFVITLVISGGPSATGVAKGLVPRLPDSSALFTTLAFIGSCAAISGVVYGTYLSKEKKWDKDEIKSGIVTWDVVLGAGSIAVIVLLILFTSARTLYPRGIKITNIHDLAETLVPLIGAGSNILLGICILAAALSSMLASAQMGATLLLAGFGKESNMDDKNVKILATAILALGAVIAIIFGSAPMQVLLVANVCAILNAPLLAVLIIMIVNRREMGEFKSSFMNNIALIACCVGLILVTAYNIAKFAHLI
jgi:manganese transport protein